MPELPEVEAARRAIEDHCIGKMIKRSIIADDPKVIDAVSPSDFEASLIGKTIVAAHRKGKNMWLQLDSPPFPSFQFGMAGAIYIKGVAVTKYKRSAVSDTDEWPSKYSKLFIELDDGLEFSFTDKRRFAKVRLLKDPASMPPISELGPDALLEPMTIDEFANSLSKKKIGIKSLLLDQGFISGIGNWIADEVLYQARIHPLHVAASLSRENCEALKKCIKEVIEKAVGVEADSSQFPSGWIFHSREKKPGKAFVDGKKIEFINAGGRTTAYVPELQKLTEIQAAIATDKPRKQAFKKGKDDNGDEAGSEEEENAKSAKSKGKKNTTRRGRKESPAKRKFNGSNTVDDDNDISDDDDGDGKKSGASKKPPVKRKSKGSGNDNNDNNGDRKKEARGRKKPTAKKKSEESGDDRDNSGDDDNDDEGGDHKETGKVMKSKQTKVEKSSKRKVRN